MKSVVSIKWLLARMYESDVVIVDCRFALGQPDAGRKAYEESHIPGAIYLDLEADLSAPLDEHGGRHPLPDPAGLAHRLAKAGISNSSRIIAYDSQGGMVASRLWWQLRYLGHEQAYVLDGGYEAWQAAGFPLTNEQRVIIPGTFYAVVQHDMLAEVYDVQDRLGLASTRLIDSREAARYRGEVEPIDKAAGHIPGAVNRFWKDSLNEHGLFKDEATQKERFADLADAEEIIVYCGSGVSACPNVLALYEAGFDNVRLYLGSWSDWISYKENPVAVGEE
ncbi:sulfurtransferase [Paenibacillus pinihumi]|uniref:sulfurtransferase n=1 Tax=Paenibacillus pinihumi TaxID=669462 RepID=UPI0004279EAF|nr:sulfurtransferase [Paenibacillus pinihumi]